MGKHRKHTPRQFLSLCTAIRSSGKEKCNNKALRGKNVCHLHKHTIVNEQTTLDDAKFDKREEFSIIAHIFFLYALMIMPKDKHDTWKWMSETIFQGMLTNIQVQSHHNRYKQWMQKYINQKNVKSVATMFSTCMSKNTHYKKYEWYNTYTIPEFINMGRIYINNVLYEFHPNGFIRADGVLKKSDFISMCALDGYVLHNQSLYQTKTTSVCKLQLKCINVLYGNNLNSIISISTINATSNNVNLVDDCSVNNSNENNRVKSCNNIEQQCNKESSECNVHEIV